MTVASTTNRDDYPNTGALTATWNYTFRILQEADLKVIKTEISTEIDTTLVLTTDYTVTDVGAVAGGTIVLVAGNLPATHRLTIKRVVALIQGTDLRNQGEFLAEVHEDEFDRGVMADQQQQDDLDRAAKLPESIDPTTFDMTLPDITGEDSITIVTNVAGTGFSKGPSTSTIEGATASAAAAAASAAAALISENAAAVDLGLTNADVVLTNADVVSTNADVVSTNADVVTTNQDTIDTAADLVATNQDTIDTAADLVATNQDTIDTAADLVLTNADVVSTGDDVTATNADVVLTNADVVLTHADVISTAADAAALSTHLTATEDMSNKTFTDPLTFQEVTTPSTPASGDRKIYPKADGKFYQINDAGLETEMGSGGAGSSDTIALIKSKDDSDTDFTLKSIDDVLPDFDGADTLGATFSVPTSGSDALLSNDDDHNVYKLATTTSTQYDAVGRSFSIPRAFRGKDILCEFQYRTADTSGDSVNGDYMLYIVDDTNMVNTTTTSTGSQVAGSSLVVGTSTGMAVGERIMVGTATGLVDSHITAIADSTHVTLADDVTLTSGDRLVTGVLTDSLTTLNAADDDTNKKGASFKKYVLVPDTCATIKFMVQQLTTETDSFLFFDNILISADPFKKVETQSKGQFYKIKQLQNAMTDITGEGRFDLGGVATIINKGEGLFTVTDDGSAATRWTITESNLEITMVFATMAATAGQNIQIYKNGAEFDAIHGQDSATNYTRQLVAKDYPDVGDYYTVYNGAWANLAAHARVSFSATPQKGTSIIIESMEGFAPETVTYTGFTSGTTTIKLKTEVTNSGNNLLAVDNTTYTKITALRDCTAFVSGNVNSSSTDWNQIWHKNAAGTTIVSSYVDSISSALYGTNTSLNVKMSAGDYIYMGVNGGTIVDADSTSLSVTAISVEAPKPLYALPTITVGQNAEDYRADTHAGYGSTATAIPYFTNVNKNTISNLGTITNDSTDGFSFTATARCKVRMTYSAIFNAAGAVGISLNGAVSTAISSVTLAQRIAYGTTPQANYSHTASTSVIMEAGDVISPHTDATTAAVTYRHHVVMVVEPELGQQNHAAIISAPVAYIKDIKGAGQDGGTATVSTWLTRDLNTLSGEIAAVGVSLNGSDQFTLPVGKFDIIIEAPGFSTTGHKAKLYDITNSTDKLYGSSAYSHSTDGSTTLSTITDTLTLTEETTFEVRHRAVATRSLNGFGPNCNMGIDEVYTVIKITRKA